MLLLYIGFKLPWNDRNHLTNSRQPRVSSYPWTSTRQGGFWSHEHSASSHHVQPQLLPIQPAPLQGLYPKPHIFTKSWFSPFFCPVPQMTLLIQPWSSPSALGYKSQVPLCNSIWAIHPLPLSEIPSPVQTLLQCYLCSHSWAIWDSFLFTILFLSSHFSMSDGDQQIKNRIFLIFQRMSVDLRLWLMSTTSLTPSYQGPAFSSQPEEGIEWCQGWVSWAISSWRQCKWPSLPWVTDHPSISLPHLLPKMLVPLFSSFTIIIFWFYFFIYFSPHSEACGILVCWPGIKPTPPALEAWSLNHWTTIPIF